MLKSIDKKMCKNNRKSNIIPAIIHEKQKKIIFYIYRNEFMREYEKKFIFSRIIKINYNEKIYDVITNVIQKDPISNCPIHIDFKLVKNNSLIQLKIPIKIINYEKSNILKKGGVLNLLKKDIMIECLTQNIPKYITIDVSRHKTGYKIKIEDMMQNKERLSSSKELIKRLIK